MASAKETPRQKMIGMMYLVLTALLALNVSKDILDAFIVVNKGIIKTNHNYDERNEQLYASLNIARDVDPKRISPVYDKAQQIKKESAALVQYIDNLQKELIEKTEGVSKEVADTIQMEYLNKKDSYDTPTSILIGSSEDGSAGASRTLKNKLSSYRDKLTGFILPEDRKTVKVEISTDDPSNSPDNENWEMYNFYNRPLVATLTILSKLKSDVKSAESQVVDYLLKQSDGEMLKFDTVAAKVVPTSNYVLLGEEYSADVFVAAFNKTKNPEIRVGNYNPETGQFEGESSVVPVNRGLGQYTAPADREGIHTYSGVVKMISGKNKEVLFPFKSEYIVARPSLTVSAEKMNVVYRGLDNPISVSVPGIPNDRLSVTASNATLVNKGGGKYMVRAGAGNEVLVNVSATMENGERRVMGTMKLRVKRIPKPTAKFGELTTSGRMTKGVIAVQRGLIAYYESFEYEANPRVSGFTMSVSSGGTAEDLITTGNMLTPAMQQRLARLKKNDKVVFENITAVGPDNETVKLSPITITIM
jgi:gliding motility-associated protein GldM